MDFLLSDRFLLFCHPNDQWCSACSLLRLEELFESINQYEAYQSMPEVNPWFWPWYPAISVPCSITTDVCSPSCRNTGKWKAKVLEVGIWRSVCEVSPPQIIGQHWWIVWPIMLNHWDNDKSSPSPVDLLISGLGLSPHRKPSRISHCDSLDSLAFLVLFCSL